jgi:hypothetical protein
MHRFLIAIVIIVGLLLSVPVLFAIPPAAVDPEQKDVAEINKGIDDGVQFLRRTRDARGHWESFVIDSLVGMEGGITSLATLALLNSGVKPTDPDVSAPLDYLRKLEPKKTYVVGIINMCLLDAKNPKDLLLIQKNVDWLTNTAVKSGGRLKGWGYPSGEIHVDASNTQYALLGLYAGKMAGAKIDDKVWKEIRDLYLTTIIKVGKDQGSWSYHEGDKRPSFTMTTAGVCGLLIARMGLDRSEQQLDAKSGIAAKCGEYPENEAIRRGMNWLGENFAFNGAESSKSLFYNVYGIERAGRLSGQRFIGYKDWYREGCDFLVLSKKGSTQRGDGSWASDNDTNFRGVNVISTAFALLFLSKGRSPVLISKMAHGEFTKTPKGLLTERSAEPEILGWNRKHNDARHLTEFASRELFQNAPLGWQVYDPRRKDFTTNSDLLNEIGTLVQSPILYITGHRLMMTTDQQKKIFKKYIEEGGFVIAEACCGSEPFVVEFRKLIAELFPESELNVAPPEHAIWQSHFLVPPNEFPKLECMNRGCRTVLVFSPVPLAGFWEERKYMPSPGKPATNRGEFAFQLAANVVAYATGKEPPKQRLAQKKVVDAKGDENSPRSGFVQPVQIKLDESPPADAAMRSLMSYLQDIARLDVVLDKKSLTPNDVDLFKFKFLYMHGKKGFDLDDTSIENIKVNLQTGGILLADACCGSEAFDTAFRKMAGKMFPEAKLEVIPPTDELYSQKLNGRLIDLVERREKVARANSGTDTGYEKLPPRLEGIKVDGRWAIVYSRYDIGCALENHKSSDCLGHSPDSAKRLAAAVVLYSLKR